MLKYKFSMNYTLNIMINQIAHSYRQMARLLVYVYMIYVRTSYCSHMRSSYENIIMFSYENIILFSYENIKMFSYENTIMFSYEIIILFSYDMFSYENIHNVLICEHHKCSHMRTS